MISQSTAAAHVSAIEADAAHFAALVSDETESVLGAVTEHLGRLKTKNGKITQNFHNANHLISTEMSFYRSLNSSGFYPLINAYVTGFTEHVGNLRGMLHEFGNFSDFTLSDSDKEVLEMQGALALAVLEGHADRVALALRHHLALSLGEVDHSHLVSGVSGIIRRLNRVEPMAKDLSIVFFRILAGLVYRKLEGEGHDLKYTYVGPESNRSFCSDLVGMKMTRDEIDQLDNGQVPGVFDSAGGYGCMHWWTLS